MNNQPLPASATDAPTYIATRLDQQIKWYDQRSSKLKRRHRWLKIISISFSALVPVSIAFSEKWAELKYAAALFGAAVTVIEGISGLLKDKDTYLGYRSASEGLLQEKMKYESRSGEDYNNTVELENFKKLVFRCELIMAGESSKWVNTFAQEAGNSQSGS